jgi:hypothetical protein
MKTSPVITRSLVFIGVIVVLIVGSLLGWSSPYSLQLEFLPKEISTEAARPVLDKASTSIPNMPMPMPIDPNKPYMVVHVGPPKTGTTTLQDALFRMSKQGILAKDNYTYARNQQGSISKTVDAKIFATSCQIELLKQRRAYNNETNGDDKSLSDSLRKVQCWNETLQDLDPYLKSKTNLIFSSEPISFKRLWTDERYTMVDWKSLYPTLSRDWNFILVFAYRRYPEWIFSSKQQENRWKPSKPRMNKWPGLLGGKELVPIRPLPSNRETMTTNKYSDYLLKEMQQYPEIPTAILNMHKLERGSSWKCPSNMSIQSSRGSRTGN